MKKRIGIIALSVMLAGSLIGNLYLMNMVEHEEREKLWYVTYPDGNTRDTYDTIHNLKEAQKVSKGAGVKVGILDWCFGFDEHENLYAGGKDFTTYSYHDLHSL